ncbi:hypothetical protein CRG98_023993 [Punica granatum]|uniref:Uncharacterized protein n=1 Tax=Punica granatum TaxID=22663 RepID=A0A2I0JI64_PUNGR|nr:hypothetical protein CRG98_023993 [Punica granatum]
MERNHGSNEHELHRPDKRRGMTRPVAHLTKDHGFRPKILSLAEGGAAKWDWAASSLVRNEVAKDVQASWDVLAERIITVISSVTASITQFMSLSLTGIVGKDEGRTRDIEEEEGRIVRVEEDELSTISAERRADRSGNR